MDSQIEHDGYIFDFFKSMINEERLKIVGVLANEKLTLEQISLRLRLPIADTAHHLENLGKLGIIRLAGQLYCLDTKAVETIARQRLAQLRQQTKAEDFEGEAYERKVLADFFTTQGKLKSLPAQHKKLLVILHFLADKEFMPDVHYPEKEVNVKLSAYFEDTASLRRYLVDNRYLAREKGIYWKLG